LESELANRLVSEQTAKKLESALSELKSSYDKEVAKRDELEKQKKQLLVQIDDLKENVDEKSSDKDKVAAAKKKAEDEAERLKDEIDDLKVSLTTNQKAFTQLKTEFDDLNSKYQKELEGKTKLDQTVKTLTRENEQLHKSLADTEAVRNDLDKTKKKIESDLATAKTELDSEIKENAKLSKLKN